MKAALLLALALGVGAPSFAADAAPPENRFAASIAPAERFETGSLLVERFVMFDQPQMLADALRAYLQSL